MGRVKENLIFIRNGLAFSFSWLILCVIAVSLIGGNEAVTVKFLIKLFMLCFWGVIAFSISFRSRWCTKKGFVFSLSIFYLLFIPIEILMFYFMGIFDSNGSIRLWIIFGVILALAYSISLLIDILIMKRKSDIYTDKMSKYISQNKER